METTPNNSESSQATNLMPIEWEKRGENYVVRLIGGEIVYTEETFKEHQNRINKLEEYANEWIEKYGYDQWAISDIPEGADLYLRLDYFFKLYALTIFKLVEESSEDRGVFLNIYTLLNSSKNKFKISIFSRYSKKNELHKYYINHLNLVIEEVKRFEKLVEVKKENLNSDRLRKRLYENTKWNKVISDWNDILKSGYSDFVVHDGRETFATTKQKINEKALKYFEYYKESFRKRTEFLIDFENELRGEYYNQTRFLGSLNKGFLNSIMVRDNELVFIDGRPFGFRNVYSISENPYTKEKHKIETTEMQMSFNWDEFLENFKNYDFNIKLRSHELISNIIGKSYHCSYLKKQILDYEKRIEEIAPTLKKMPTVSKREKKQNLTFLEFFHNDQKKVDLFFEALTDLGAIDKNNNWIYRYDSSICSCLQALFSLSKDYYDYTLVNHSYDGEHKALFNMVKSEITIKCKYNNFKVWHKNINRIKVFKNKFRNVFSNLSS